MLAAFDRLMAGVLRREGAAMAAELRHDGRTATEAAACGHRRRGDRPWLGQQAQAWNKGRQRQQQTPRVGHSGQVANVPMRYGSVPGDRASPRPDIRFRAMGRSPAAPTNDRFPLLRVADAAIDAFGPMRRSDWAGYFPQPGIRSCHSEDLLQAATSHAGPIDFNRTPKR